MIDSKAKRAAALGYGLSFLLVLPLADGSISIEDAGHALSAYRYDMPAAEPRPSIVAIGLYAPTLVGVGLDHGSLAAIGMVN